MKLVACLTSATLLCSGFAIGVICGKLSERAKVKSEPTPHKAMPSSLEYRSPKTESKRLSFTF